MKKELVKVLVSQLQTVKNLENNISTLFEISVHKQRKDLMDIARGMEKNIAIIEDRAYRMILNIAASDI